MDALKREKNDEDFYCNDVTQMSQTCGISRRHFLT